MPITAQVNVRGGAAPQLEEQLKHGNDLLCIMFSSALSGTYNSVRVAAQELEAKYPKRRVVVIDSLAASAGQGMLVARAVDYKEQGLPLEENAARIREDIPAPGASVHRSTTSIICAGADAFPRRRRLLAPCWASNRCCMWTTRAG